ncbi:MAG: tetratricopeptide repeat protein [Planctomycetes bacterium]|nr:tetratricopeptide repeat protein [Planctomycetota bacterium]
MFILSSLALCLAALGAGCGPGNGGHFKVWVREDGDDDSQEEAFVAENQEVLLGCQGKTEEAIDHFSRALKARPD